MSGIERTDNARILAHQADNAVRTIVNEAAQASPVQPIVNMGQGFFGYNPPKFVLDAAKAAIDKVDCNQYSPTKVQQQPRQSLAWRALIVPGRVVHG